MTLCISIPPIIKIYLFKCLRVKYSYLLIIVFSHFKKRTLQSNNRTHIINFAESKPYKL